MLSDGGEGAPFQSFSVRVRERIFLSAELLSRVARQDLFCEQPEFGGLDAPGGHPPEIDGQTPGESDNRFLARGRGGFAIVEERSPMEHPSVEGLEAAHPPGELNH
jgi:hypothetical protein